MPNCGFSSPNERRERAFDLHAEQLRRLLALERERVVLDHSVQALHLRLRLAIVFSSGHRTIELGTRGHWESLVSGESGIVNRRRRLDDVSRSRLTSPRFI